MNRPAYTISPLAPAADPITLPPFVESPSPVKPKNAVIALVTATPIFGLVFLFVLALSRGAAPLTFVKATAAGAIGAAAGTYLILRWVLRSYQDRLSEHKLSAVAAMDRRERERIAALKRAREEAQVRSEAEAKYVTTKAQQQLDVTERLVQLYVSHIDAARRSTSRAANEFDSRAYGPFWDAVESAAVNLAKARDVINAVHSAGTTYNGLLRGRKHTFPPFPVSKMLETRPHEKADLQQLIRKGQTDINFALIWEQRQTREVFISGFNTLAEALSSVEDSLTGALLDLEAVVRQGFDRSHTVTAQISDTVSAIKSNQESSYTRP